MLACTHSSRDISLPRRILCASAIPFWEEGKLRHGGRVDMTRTALEGFGKSLSATDEVVIEATDNCMAAFRVYQDQCSYDGASNCR